jgi:adenylosuccinate synthase
MYTKKIIVLLSGEIASGKSTVCDGLIKQYGFHLISTREILTKIALKKYKGEIPKERGFLQKFGRDLDQGSNGGWVLNEIQSELQKYERILIDSVRIPEQIASFRMAYGQAVVHIYLHAPTEWRKEHFISRKKETDFLSIKDASKKFGEYSADPTEMKVHELKEIADLVIYTADSAGERDQVIRAASFLRLLPPVGRRNVDVVIGGQFGSEGKGQIAAYLAPEYDCLVRVGGPNAGHKVYNEPEPDVFHIIPSGSVRAPQSLIVIGPGAVISEDIILDEIHRFGIDSKRIIIDENVTLIEPRDIVLETKLDKIGSTKQGVGAATAKNIIERLKSNSKHKAKNSKKLKQYIGKAHEVFEEMHAKNNKILLEGTQGTLLSLHHGDYPHVTSRDTTVGGCLAECGFGPFKVRKIVMVARRYPIRVKNPDGGTSGEFYSTELDFKEIARRAGYPLNLLKKTEKTSTTKKTRRIAEFSWDLFRRACETNTPTDIALTFADYIQYSNQKARRYDQLSADATKFIDEMERCAGVPVSLISTRFAHRAVIDRRNWI